MDLLSAFELVRNKQQKLEVQGQTIAGLNFEGNSLQYFELSYDDSEGPWFSIAFSSGKPGSSDGETEIYGHEAPETLLQELLPIFPAVGSINFFNATSGLHDCTADHILESIFEELPTYDSFFPDRISEYMSIGKKLVLDINERTYQ